jgi:S-(hydroxymethyl)glutathione dehydrogenase/alcohol dehydrogenase
VDRSLPLEQVALLGCAVMTGVGAVLNTAGVRPAESVVVIGCGGVGLSVIQGARIAGASPIVAVDVVASKLDLARELGATDVVLGDDDPDAAIRAVLPDGADHAFEALGRAQTIELATRVAGPGGTAVLIGMAAPDARPTIDALTLTLEERRIVGCWYGSCVPPRDFPMLVDLVLSGALRLDAMIGRTFELDGINEALDLFEQGSEARSVIVYAE